MSGQTKKRVRRHVKYLYKVVLDFDIVAFNAILNNLGEQGYKVRRVEKLYMGWWALMQKRTWVKAEEAK